MHCLAELKEFMLHLFNKTEIKYLLIIFTFLILVTGINIKTSLRKGRDTTRKNDMSAMQKEVDTFLQKYKELTPKLNWRNFADNFFKACENY